MRAITLLVVAIVAACGSETPAASRSNPSPDATVDATIRRADPQIDLAGTPDGITVEAAAATATWVGPAGTVLSAQSADGTRYELAIPAGAVLEPTAVTMAPITAIEDLGLSGGLIGAVLLQPPGLQLAEPATLRIDAGRTAPAGARVVGFDGSATQLIPAFADGLTAVVQVFHFSAPGAGFGTSEDMATLSAPPSGTLAGALSLLLGFDVPWSPARGAEAKAVLLVAWDQLMRPALEGATDDGRLLQALADWRQFVFLLNLVVHGGDAAAALADGQVAFAGGDDQLLLMFTAGQSLVAQQIVRAVIGNLDRCRQDHDLVAYANVLFWADSGTRYSPESRNWVGDTTGCATIVVASADLPQSLVAGGSDILEVGFAIEFFDGQRAPADFAVGFQGVGFTFSPGGGTSITRELAAGTLLTAGVDAQQGPPYGLRAQPCWFLDGIARNACADFTLPFDGAPDPTTVITPPPSADQGLVAPDITGTYAVTLVCSGAVYGDGQATVTRAGNTVQVSWTVQVTPPDSGGLCHDAAVQAQFPTSGSYAGTLSSLGSNQFDIVLTDWSATPCLAPSPAPASARYDAGRAAIGIPVGRCPPAELLGSMGYSTQRLSR